MEKDFEREVLDRLTKIEVKLDGYTGVKNKVYDNERSIMVFRGELQTAKDDIKALQDSQSWLIKSIAGAIIAALISLGFALMKSGIGG